MRNFDELDVGAQLAELLLARLVLTDASAQLHVVPLLLGARSAAGINDDTQDQLFDVATFQRYIVPRLVQLFAVHEAQTRLILLEYFGSYVRRISDADLREHVLPQLLLGIKDTDDVLVAATLRALAELVPLLGATTVIGRNRQQIFSDGRPTHQTPGGRNSDIAASNRTANRTTATATADLSAVPADWMEHRSITPVLMTTSHQHGGGSGGGLMMVNGNGSASLSLLNHSNQQLLLHHNIIDLSESGSQGLVAGSGAMMLMPERLSPDGGEDEKTASDAPDLETDAWSDWEADEVVPGAVDGISENDDDATEFHDEHATIVDADSLPVSVKPLTIPTKTQTSSAVPLTKPNGTKPDSPPEIDYFADMEPVIQKTNVLLIAEQENTDDELSKVRNNGTVTATEVAAVSLSWSRLNAADEVEVEAGGWGDDADEWEDG